MSNYVIDEITDKQIFKSIELVNELMYNKGLRYLPYMFKPIGKNEISLAVMIMDFVNVSNIPRPIGSFVKNNKTDINICLKSLAKFINNEIVNNYSTIPVINNKVITANLIDSILST